MLARLSLAVAALSIVSATTTQLVGCTTNAQIDHLQGATSGSAADISGCAAACKIMEKWYSLYSSADKSCFCSNDLTVDKSAAIQGTCADYSISIIRPTLSSAAQVQAPPPAQVPIVLPISEPQSSDIQVLNPPEKRAGGPMCEPNQIACATLAGSGGGFECVNIEDNARYCGGCPNGLFQQDPSTATGRDCTRLPPPGAAHLSTICYNSACAATECQPGYKWLPDGSCIWKGLPNRDARTNVWGSRH